MELSPLPSTNREKPREFIQENLVVNAVAGAGLSSIALVVATASLEGLGFITVRTEVSPEAWMMTSITAVAIGALAGCAVYYYKGIGLFTF